jgi:tetratricopeptide (TPR) repeat protein
VSPRARVVAIVSAVAVAAAGGTVAGALVQGREAGGEVHGQTEAERDRAEPPALELAVLAPGDESRALVAAERLYEEGDAAAAEQAFAEILEREPDSVESAVGAAVAAWPIETRERLEDLAEEQPRSAVVQLNLGLLSLAEGDVDAARQAWREAERREPDSPAALRAEDLLNPRSPPGRPVFVSARVRAGEALARALASGLEAPLAQAAAQARRGDANAWLRVGLAYQQLGRRESARAAFDRAAAAEPGSLEPQVAAAVARYDKDDPSRAFSRLGPLASRNGQSGLVRFHLGLMLLWLPNVEEARRQLGLARKAGGFYGRQAARILAQLDADE